MEPKRFWARILLVLAACSMAAFIVLANTVTAEPMECKVPNEKCLAGAVQALDPPFLWLLPAGAGLALAGAGFLVAAAHREPPRRAIGFTWDDWENEAATH